MLLQDDPQDAAAWGSSSLGGRRAPRPRSVSPGALVAVGVLAGTLAVARDPGAGRLAVVILATVALAVAVLAVRARVVPERVQRRTRRPGRRAFLGTAFVGVFGVALLAELGWWDPMIALPGLTFGTAIAQLRPLRDAGRPSRGAWMAIGVLAVASPWLWSFETSMAAVNSDALSVRAVEWVRDHGGVGIVDSIEHWWYTHHQPPVGGKPKELTKPAVPPAAAKVDAPDPSLTRVPTPAGTPIGNEGVWVVTSGSVARPAVATTLVRPDAVHTSLVVGVLRIDPRYARLRLLAGTEQPGGGSPNGAMVPVADRSSLLAAFNAGFRMTESRGGWYSDGRTVVPLQDGSASLVLRDDGRADVGVWGRDDHMDPHVTAVRQNLALIVDGGRPVNGIDDSANLLWGRTVGHKVLVARSGIGVTATGALVYVGGPGMSVQTLANTLIAAGAVRAMELDINTDWVEAYTFRPSALGPVGTKLVDVMHDPPTHYLAPETRDFVEVLSSGR